MNMPTIAISILMSASLAAGCNKGPKTEAHAAAAPWVAAAPVGSGASIARGAATFGAGVKLTESTPIATILADPKAFAGKTVRVEGLVVDVCEKRGCWFEMAGPDAGQKMRFKVVDGDMVFPVDAKGKYAVAEGVIAVRDMSLEDSVAYAKYQAEEQSQPFDPASVTKPLSVVRIDGTGATMRDKL
jgi:Domain of unknown function (DUF4920)